MQIERPCARVDRLAEPRHRLGAVPEEGGVASAIGVPVQPVSDGGYNSNFTVPAFTPVIGLRSPLTVALSVIEPPSTTSASW